MAEKKTVTACLLIVGDEVLSGRTRDANLQVLGMELNEIGIRMALGAKTADVKRMVLRESLAVVGVGVGVGLVGVLATGPLLASLLFALAPTDASPIAQAVPMMIVVAAIASYLPARRAARLDPLIALRRE